MYVKKGGCSVPLDSITISALCAELGALLTDARIDKIQQPERDTILLSLRSERSFRLLLCGGVGTARAHITEAAFENPAQPPRFCMLLRKHLTGARIAAVEQPGRERALTFWLDALDELRSPVRKRLVLELIGRGTNLILVDGEGIIIDCLRRVDAEMNPQRQILPGLRYRPPERQAKTDFFALDAGERRALWERRAGDEPAKWLMDTFSGLSPLLCRELEHRGLPESMDALSERVAAGEFTPYMLTQDGKPKDFSCLPIAQYGAAMEGEVYPSFSALLDAFYTRRGQAEEMRRKTSALRKTVKGAHGRALRKIALQTEELARTGEREALRRRADLITANLYRAPKGGAGSMTVEDFYEEGSPSVTIPLDPLKTAQQNAAAYYKEYNKAKTAERYLTALVAENRADAEYLASVLDELDRAISAADVAAIRSELTASGFLKKERRNKGGKAEKIKEAAPLRYVSSGGYEILVGRNNAQNDTLTLRTASKGDLWFHTQKIHGSHVILRCAGETPDEGSLREAASLAALHSQAAAGGRVSVDYTRVKLVKKPAGARPGMVVYTGQTTLAAEADEALAERLKA